ncbi:MAG: peptidoglycan-binding protein, partial [Leptospirales bacterium]|nr:peptidoglycan-binding protein [Leptospirales bacterium]
AVLGSKVKTCNDPMPDETCEVIAIGKLPRVPIEIPVTNPIDRSVINPRWDKAKAMIGEKVRLQVELKNQYENATVEYKIYPEGADTKKDQPIQKLYERNEGGKSEAEWAIIHPEELDEELERLYRDAMENEGLAPVTTVRGIQERLIKLGFICKETGELDDETTEAVNEFQKKHGLKTDGIPGTKTQEKIESEYESLVKRDDTEAKELKFKYIFTAVSFGCAEVKSGVIDVEPGFIEIELLDTEGKGISGEPYKITLGDGNVIKGILDSKGYAKVYVKDPENGKVTFPLRDEGEWDIKK